MSNQMQTSTPLIFPKSGSHSSRTSWLNQDETQQLYRNAWNKFKSPEKGSWDSIEGPKFVDFDNGPSDIRDSYFDRRQSDFPTPQKKEEMVLPTPDDAMDIVDSLESCCISTIINSSTDVEDNTLMADETLEANDPTQSLGPSQGNSDFDTSRSDRRLSIVQPFSFELREKENQQRRESRRAYYKMLAERNTPQPFKAKPAPKFIQRCTTINTPVNANNNTSINTTPNANDNEIELESTPKRIIRVPRKADVNATKVPEKTEKPRTTVQVPKVMKSAANPCLQNAKSTKNSIQHQQTATAFNPFLIQPKVKAATNAKSPHKVKPASNPFSFHSKNINATNTLHLQQTGKNASNPSAVQSRAKIASNQFQLSKPKDSTANVHIAKNEKPNGYTGDIQDGGKSSSNSIQIKKQKPFQVSLPHRKIEIPKPPVLLTAKRALERQQFVEKLKERERQREEIRKMEAETQQAREQEEFARLRKQTVFKARPVPQYKNVLPQMKKRPLTEPMMPIFLKRRRVH